MADEVFSKEWLAGGKIACYRFISTGSEAAEKWFTEIVDLFTGWDRSKPLLLLIDVSTPNNPLSPEALRAARQASQEQPNVAGKTALLIDGSESSHNVRALVDQTYHFAYVLKSGRFRDHLEMCAHIASRVAIYRLPRLAMPDMKNGIASVIRAHLCSECADIPAPR